MCKLLPLKDYHLKVHKNENFFGSVFIFCSISLLVTLKYLGFVKNNFDWAIIGEGTIIPLSLKSKGDKKFCQVRPNFQK
jgi:hypothetical protein